ncbi:MAG: hypothetical protein AAGH41_06695 [Pseudomonadota bacterium]
MPGDFTPTIAVGDQATIARGETKLVGTIAAKRSAVLEAPAEIGRKTYKAGTVFLAAYEGRVPKNQGEALPVSGYYCAFVDRTNVLGSDGRHDCLHDSDGDGVFDKALVGDSFDDGAMFEAFSAVEVPLETPVRYRKAGATSPATYLGMRLCSVEGVPRFALAAESTDGFALAGLKPCLFGKLTDDGHVEVGDIVLDVTPNDQSVAYRVVAAPKARGPVLVPGAGIALRDFSTPETTRDEAVRSLDSLLSAVGSNVVTAEAARFPGRKFKAAKGAVFLQAKADYGTTGTLSAPFSFRSPVALGWLGSRTVELPVGTPVYGARLGSFSSMIRSLQGAEQQITWCALDQNDGSDRWNSLCFPIADQGGSYMIREDGTLFVTSLSSTTPPGRTTPVVKQGPAELGPELTASMSIAAVRRQALYVDIALRTPSGQRQSLRRSLRLSEKGNAKMRLSGASALLFSVDEDRNVTVTVEGPLELPAGTGLY